MNKMWCIKFKYRRLLGWKYGYIEFMEDRIDNALKEFKEQRPGCAIVEIYVQYRHR